MIYSTTLLRQKSPQNPDTLARIRNTSPHVRESGLWNPRIFRFWNSESCKRLESGIQVTNDPNNNNTGISHVFEMWIGMNEFDHRILALLKQQRERPENSDSSRGASYQRSRSRV